jgi:YVTN family beta-propeller protein
LVAAGRNENTDTIYVANSPDTRPGTVSVINGLNSKVTATIPASNFPDSIAVNPRNNQVYVVNSTAVSGRQART